MRELVVYGVNVHEVAREIHVLLKDEGAGPGYFGVGYRPATGMQNEPVVLIPVGRTLAPSEYEQAARAHAGLLCEQQGSDFVRSRVLIPGVSGGGITGRSMCFAYAGIDCPADLAEVGAVLLAIRVIPANLDSDRAAAEVLARRLLRGNPHLNLL